MKFVRNGIIKKCDVIWNMDHNGAIELYLDLIISKGYGASFSTNIKELTDIGIDPIARLLKLTRATRLSEVKDVPIQVVIEGEDKEAMSGAIIIGVANFLADLDYDVEYLTDDVLIPIEYFKKEIV